MNVLFSKNSVILLLTIILSTVAFCAVEGYVEAFKINITADDGEVVVLTQHEHMSEVPFNKKSALIYLFDEKETCLLGTFSSGNYLFTENEEDYTIILKKVLDFENVTLYDFILTYTYIDYHSSILRFRSWHMADEYHPQPPMLGETLTYTLKIWIDKEDGIYSGSLTYTPIELTVSSFEAYEYYKGIEDVLLYLAKEEFNNFEKDFNKGMPHEVDFYFDKILKSIMINDLDTGEKLQKEFNILRTKNIDVMQQFIHRENTKIMLTWYTSSISTLKERLDYNRTIFEGLLSIPDRPEVADEYPVTEKELEAYKDWLLDIFMQRVVYRNGIEQIRDTPLDDYWNPVKFELVDGGVKATSAGPDKIFGTDDDLVYINRIEVQMELK